MFRTTAYILATATAAIFFPMTAHAGQGEPDAMTEASATPKVVIFEKDTEDVRDAVNTATPDGVVPVVDNNGRVFFNRVITPDALPKVKQDVNVVDTYTYEHDGRVYTNKIVAK